MTCFRRDRTRVISYSEAVVGFSHTEELISESSRSVKEPIRPVSPPIDLSHQGSAIRFGVSLLQQQLWSIGWR